jgi:hypothetical protein
MKRRLVAIVLVAACGDDGQTGEPDARMRQVCATDDDCGSAVCDRQVLECVPPSWLLYASHGNTRPENDGSMGAFEFFP